MITIHVDGVPGQVNEKENLLHGCLTLGYDLPYFCWHPAMGSVGACRQCAVRSYKDEKDTRGRIVMACMTPPAPGMRISITEPEVAAFRRMVIEGLMESHPHDCPVCDEGGECHLQDMTVMTGHNYRKYRFEKRTFRNQYLGPFVNHEMNRCIQCYRCVRFYRDYAGGRDLDAFGIRNLVYFGRKEDGVLENEFAGNLVEVCPTGVFTDRTLRFHYTRKWDLTMAPSICVHCGVGCNITPGERYGVLRRILNRYNGELNGYFLCDRGRFGYGFVNDAARIRRPTAGREAARVAICAEEAVAALTETLSPGRRVIGIGSPRASLESNFMLRQLVGAQNFFSGMSDHEGTLVALILEILRTGPARTPSLREIEECDAVFVLGEDVPNTAPRMALSLRRSLRQKPLEAADQWKIPRWLDHAVKELSQDERGPLHVAAPCATRLDEVATTTARAAPAELALFAEAVAGAIEAGAPGGEKISKEWHERAARVAADLAAARKPLIVSGTGCGSAAVIRAAANVARALRRTGRDAALALVVPEANSLGLALFEPAPLGRAFQAARDGKVDAVVVLENDLYRRAPAPEIDAFLGAVSRVVALDHLENRTVERADLVFPAGTFAESDGTQVNGEGRAQRFFQVFVPEGEIQESWRWLSVTRPVTLDAVVYDMGQAVPALQKAREAAPPASFRLAGSKVAREPHRFSGRTAMLAHRNVSEPRPPADPDSALTFTMEGTPRQPPPALLPFFWSPGWNSMQSVNKFQEEIAGPLKGGDPGVRLFEPTGRPEEPCFESEAAGPAADSRPDWLAIPLFHIFGSEELSGRSAPVAELAPKPYVALNAEDAGKAGITSGTPLVVHVSGMEFRLPAVVRHDLPRGLAGLPVGLDGLSGLPLPAPIRIERAP